jgi:hypothetical protein
VFLFTFGTVQATVLGNYGFNDDYVMLGLVQLTTGKFQEILSIFLTPTNSGRFFSSIIQASYLLKFNEIEHLSILRTLTSIVLGLSALLVFSGAVRLKYSVPTSFILSTLIIFAPGIFVISVTGFVFSYILSFYLVLCLSWYLTFNSINNYLQMTILAIILFVVGNGYQPLMSAILFFPLLRFGKDNIDQFIYLRNAVISYVFSLGSNYLFVLLFSNTNRISIEIDFQEKIYLMLKKIIPMTISPHIFLQNVNVAVLTSYLILFVFFTIIMHYIFKKENKYKKISVEYRTYYTLSALGWVPLTTGWLFIITEDKVYFRMLIGATIIFWLSIVIYLDNFISRFRLAENLRYFAAFSISVFLVFTYIDFRISTVIPQVKQWGAAICASEKIQLNQNSVLDSKIINLTIPNPKRLYEDEYSIESLFFPGPQIFIPTLANNKILAREKITNPWQIRFSENQTSEEGRKWSNQYRKCLTIK